MQDAIVSTIYPSDKKAFKKIDALLEKEGLIRDANLDYSCAIYDEHFNIIATGSAFGPTLRCFAVDSSHQGEGLLNKIVSHLMDMQFGRGNLHLFLYSKVESAKFFSDLGFFEIARVEEKLVFMENRKSGFNSYLKHLSQYKKDGISAAIVMNANPFTLGHQYLVENAAKACDALHLFVLSEDTSLVPFSVRKKLVVEGVSHLKNVFVHDSGPYIISSATFPSYFLKDEALIIESHAKLDLAIFTEIAQMLNIRIRFVGEEPKSFVTGIYNNIMRESLPKAGVDCVIIPRKQEGGKAISASDVRLAIKTGDFTALKKLVPKTTYDFFQSEEAKPIIETIAHSGNVIHY